ncbi:MAG: DNA mismatch repair protein MutS [Planctomycetota bacterium]|nr:DNA mismatch repair protein MutS [Planctomycetota bacterium]
MRQHAKFKSEHPDCLLLFRIGDFYELFDDDAVAAHQALGITLTQRSVGIPMAGIPWHSSETYIRRLVDHGFRVAIADQVQDARDAKGVVDRAVTRVVTPGTRVDESLLDASAGNRVACVSIGSGDHANQAAVASAELSTGLFDVVLVPAHTVRDALALTGGVEVLLPEETTEIGDRDSAALCRAIGASRSARPGWYWRDADASEALLNHFGAARLAGLGLPDSGPVISACGALLRYLIETQGHCAKGTSHLRPPRIIHSGDRLILDATSLASLEVEKTIRSGREEGSLLASLGSCQTSMGRRLMRDWLCSPLAKRTAIQVRHSAVEALQSDPPLLARVHNELSAIQDLARIGARMGMGRATPRDVIAAGRSLAAAQRLAKELSASAANDAVPTLADDARMLVALSDDIARQCVDSPPTHLREGGLFRDGIDEALDESRALRDNANAWLAQFQKRVIEESGIESLKVGFNRVFGYYIEVPHAHASRMPSTFARRQTVRNAERFVNEELKEFEIKVLGAEAAATERELALFSQLCQSIHALREPLVRLSDAIAAVDCLATFAAHARRHDWVRPSMVEGAVIDIAQGRHPVVDTLLGERFVPNDALLGDRAPKLALITGPNMAGKSTYIRQVALITLLAHAGSFVPATKARIGLTDRIFTRIGASDELHSGQSTFMVEMTETAGILHASTERSLVIMDEVGRGTSTQDGLSLAWAITERLVEIGCRTLFATHYHELTELADSLPGVTNLHVAVREWNERIIFLHQIRPGRTDRSYGIHVAELAGIPAPTVERARRVLETIAAPENAASIDLITRRSPPTPAREPTLFDPPVVEHPAIEALRLLDLDRMTPLAAFDALRAIREKLSGS